MYIYIYIYIYIISQNIKPPTSTHILSSVQLSTWERSED